MSHNVHSFGAKGDGVTDDTDAIQACLDRGGVIKFEDRTYMIDAVKSLRVRSDSTVNLGEATLKVIPNDSKGYAVLTIKDVFNVKIIDGTISGDRDDHQGSEGEWGHGVKIIGNAKNITINGTAARELWGDGFYIGGGSHINLTGVWSDHNRRQGLSITGGQAILVQGSTFSNTSGTRPMDGIDIEPDKSGIPVKSVTITKCKFINNKNSGIELAGKHAPITDTKGYQNQFSGQRPLKINDVVGESRYRETWWMQVLGFFGVWSAHPTDFEIRG